MTEGQQELPGTEAATEAPKPAKAKAPKPAKAKAPKPAKAKAPKPAKAKARRHPNEPLGEIATHYTDSDTRKYQANGPVAWARAFREFAGRGGREGEGIRMALAYAAAHSDQVLKWKDREDWRHAARGNAK